MKGYLTLIDNNPWSELGLDGWSDLSEITSLLDHGADPDLGGVTDMPLHTAAENGSPEVVALLAGRVRDVDAMHDGHTALFRAVHARRPDNARVLVAAGADPWKSMMSGWSPGRLSLAGPTPDLFPRPDGAPGLRPNEISMASESVLLTRVLGEYQPNDGMAITFVAALDASEVARRLKAQHLSGPVPGGQESWGDWENPEDSETIVGVTAVEGGAVVIHPWSSGLSSRMLERISQGTVAYQFFVNPTGSQHGQLVRDGKLLSYGPPPDLFEISCGMDGDEEDWDDEDWDEDWEDDEDEDEDEEEGPNTRLPSSDDVLASYLFDGSIGYCCAAVGLRPTDTRAFTGPPDAWLRLPQHLLA